ncbi:MULTISPECIES: hypothetical protein [Bacillus]|uniref:hypothetical protein n=1 Tax=Bacillus TaxID=1386 RepID=UPI0002F2DE02|nr:MULTISPECIES: hypothetical protein [Bacillus]
MNIDERKVKRLELYQRSIGTAYQQLKDVLYSDNSDEVFIALKSLLDLIFSADEMHFERKGYFKRRDNDKKGIYLNGLRYAVNLLKHERICFEVQQVTTVPMFEFPLEIPEEGIEMGIIQVEWVEVDTLPNSKLDDNKNFVFQKKRYNERLVGNEIFKAIDAGIEFLLKAKNDFVD